MKCRACGKGIMQKVGEIGSYLVMKCPLCGHTINRQPEDVVPKSIKRARRELEKSRQPQRDSLTEEYIRCEQRRTELSRKKEARAERDRRRIRRAKEGRYSTLDDVIAKEAWPKKDESR